MQKNKKSIMIALFLMITIAITTVALPTVYAHNPPWSKVTWTYIAVTPTPIGVGQSALIVFWLDTLPQTASGQYGDRYTFTVDVIKPDGTNETLGPIGSDPVGGGYTNYVPTQEGNYTFVAKFPGIKYAGVNPPPGGFNTAYAAYINDTLQPSTSNPITVVVQNNPIQEFQGAALPTDYWTRPIYAENRAWNLIAGNWLGGTEPNQNYQPYSTAPNTAHIVWTKPMEFGGIANGGSDVSYYTGSAYESFWSAGIIIQGRLFYNEPKAPRYGWYSVDLRTGEQIFYNNGTGPIQVGSQTSAHIGATNIPWQFAQLSFGQIYDYDSPNQHGDRAYVWSTYTDTFGSSYKYTMQNGTSYSFNASAGSTVWQMYNAFNGDWICNIANVPSGTRITGPTGELLIYTYNSAGYLTLWNSSKALEFPNNNLGVQYSAYQSAEAFYWMWREPIGRTVDGNNGYSWNVTAPKSLGSITKPLSDMIIGTSGFGSYGMNAYTIWSLSLKQGTIGTLLWSKNYQQPPVVNATLTMGPMDEKSRIFTVWVKETNQWYGYNLDTGAQVWGPTAAAPGYDMYGVLTSIAYGKLFAGGWAGILSAYDINTGTRLWQSTLNTGKLEGPYPYWPVRGKLIVADEKVYVTTDEHSHTQPLLRGWGLYCFDANSGNNLWNISGLYGYGSISIADGYLVGLDNMNNELTCFGQGQTATTISASPQVSVLGNSVIVQGTITDQSPGAKGTAAISDASMTNWMEYLYHQQPMPTNAKGVEVSIDTLDPNGNLVHIGNTTSDTSGAYGYAFKPEVPGLYTIIASFDGSKSYYSSRAETMINIQEAPAATATPTPTAASVADMYFVPAIVGLFIFVAIIGAVIILVLRKRP
jgi:hypothetical protein